MMAFPSFHLTRAFRVFLKAKNEAINSLNTLIKGNLLDLGKNRIKDKEPFTAKCNVLILSQSETNNVIISI
jgi:hypothetical protein